MHTSGVCGAWLLSLALYLRYINESKIFRLIIPMGNRCKFHHCPAGVGVCGGIGRRILEYVPKSGKLQTRRRYNSSEYDSVDRGWTNEVYPISRLIFAFITLALNSLL